MNRVHESLPSFGSSLAKPKQLRAPQAGSWLDVRGLHSEPRPSTRDPTYGAVRQMPPLAPSSGAMEHQMLLKRGMHDDSSRLLGTTKSGRFHGAPLDRHLPSRDGSHLGRMSGASLGALSRVTRRHADVSGF
jgi:hypothetical protein